MIQLTSLCSRREVPLSQHNQLTYLHFLPLARSAPSPPAQEPSSAKTSPHPTDRILQRRTLRA